jgi:hypothetical protein
MDMSGPQTRNYEGYTVYLVLQGLKPEPHLYNYRLKSITLSESDEKGQNDALIASEKTYK